MLVAILIFSVLGAAGTPVYSEKSYAVNVAILAGVAFLYCVPMLSAAFSRHPSTSAIIVLNLIAGWTAIGWLIALVWAAMAPRNRST